MRIERGARPPIIASSLMGASKSTVDWNQSSTSMVNAHRGGPGAPPAVNTGAGQGVIEKPSSIWERPLGLPSGG